jgi:phospholipid transport system substrate-binding protein
MPTRRTATAMIGIAALLVMPPGLVRIAQAQPGEQAVSFVKTTSDQLVAIVNSEGSPEDKHRHLQTVIDSTVDVDHLARFCLSRFWRIATPDQQSQYKVLFHELLVTEIAGHLGEYQGVRVTMGLARASEDTQIVITRIERPQGPPTQIDWVVATGPGGPRIVDLLAEGTSMRLTQTADFTAYLSRHQYNVHELIEGMRERIAQNQ